MRLRLAALRAAGAPLKRKKKWFTALHLCKFALITHHATKSVNQSIALPS